MQNEGTAEVNSNNNGMNWSAERLANASYRELGTPPEVVKRFLHHLLSSKACRSSLETLLRLDNTTSRDFSLEISTYDLMAADPVLGHLLLRYPSTLLPVLETAIVEAQVQLKTELLEQHRQQQQQQQQQQQEGGESTVPKYFVKGAKLPSLTRVHARLLHLPPYCSKSALATIEAKDVGKIVQLGGVVVRASAVQMYESKRTYRCEGKNGCGYSFSISADLEQRNNNLAPPKCCPNFVSGGQKCRGTSFQQGESVHTDYQEIKIQEAASRIGVGHIPRSLLIKLQHDLVDRCQPGDEVVVVGSLLAQWQQSVAVGVDCDVGIALQAHSIKVVQEKGSSAWNSSEGGTSVSEIDKLRKEFDAFWNDPVNKEKPIAARNFICTAVCPKLYGMHIIKLALLITLIGGVSSESYANTSEDRDGDGDCDDDDEVPSQPSTVDKNEPEPFQFSSGKSSRANTEYNYADEKTTSMRFKDRKEAVKTRRRDQSHMLLVGDPGTGKSQFLRFANALCPRSVLTTGVGTTSAGLTCAAVREGSGKEFVLEAGALVLADKGVCCIDEFGCIQDQDRTTIHEAMEQQTLSVAKAGIVCKLNCRATIIAVMNPRNCLYENQESLAKNTGLGTPLLSRFDLIFKLVDTSDASRDTNITKYLLNRAIQGSGFECSEGDDFGGTKDAAWNMEKLRGYIAFVKDRFHPVMSDDAAKLLEQHYEKCRLAGSSTIPSTVRFLESMIRLSQAHARLMYRNVVTLEDAAAVIRVLECSAFAYGGFDANVDDIENVMYCDPMTMAFSAEDADTDFLLWEYKLLHRHGMVEKMSQSRREIALQSIASEGGGFPFDIGNPSLDHQGWNSREHPRDRNASEDHYGRIHISSQPRHPLHSQQVNQSPHGSDLWNEPSDDYDPDAAKAAHIRNQRRPSDVFTPSSFDVSHKRRRM